MVHHNVFVNGVLSNITVEQGVILSVEPSGVAPQTLDIHHLSMAIPSMVNMHTHSAMTLLRSTGTGLPLQQWLHEAIFPFEARLTPDDIYRGALQACKEMTGSGTTAFNDMYFSIESTIRAAKETHMSGNIALSVTDPDFTNGNVKRFMQLFERLPLPSLCKENHITISLAPHAIYTVSSRNLQYAADFAKEHDTLFHIHLSETLKEREDCIREHGVPPVVYLDRLGIFEKVGNRFIGAHSLWLDQDEIAILGQHHATVVHCPCSNLKLGSGFRFLYTELRDAGVNVTLGTDGSASSDNLNLAAAAKYMALLQKGFRNDPSVLPAEELLNVVTSNGRRALRLPDNSILPGNIADFFIISLDKTAFFNLDLSLTPSQLHHDLLNRYFFAN